MKKSSMVSVYCSLTDVQLDSTGDIHIFLKKDKVATSEEAVRKLRMLLNKDVTVIVTEFNRGRQ